jgi:hypothetical protein
LPSCRYAPILPGAVTTKSITPLPSRSAAMTLPSPFSPTAKSSGTTRGSMDAWTDVAAKAVPIAASKASASLRLWRLLLNASLNIMEECRFMVEW